MEALIIGIIIQGIVVIIVKNMDIFLRIILGHTSEVTTKGGWFKPHVLAAWRLVTLVNTFQQDQRHQVVRLIKEKARQMLNTSKMRWTSHGKIKMFTERQMEKGSLHPMGQVVTPHQTRKKGGMWDWYSKVLSYINFKIVVMKKIN